MPLSVLCEPSQNGARLGELAQDEDTGNVVLKPSWGPRVNVLAAAFLRGAWHHQI